MSVSKDIAITETRWSHSLAGLGLGILWVGVLCSFVGAQGGLGNPPEGLWEEMVAGWRQLEQIDKEPKSCLVRFVSTSQGERSELQGHLAVGDGICLFATDRMVYVVAPWYGFLLQRQDMQQEKWLLIDMYRPEQLRDAKLESMEHHPLRIRSQCLRPLSAYGIGGIRLTKMAEISAIQIDRVEGGEGSLLTVQYTSRSKNPSSKAVEQIRMVVDREACYCPVEIQRSNTAQPQLFIEERRTIISKQPIRCGSYSYRTIYDGKVINDISITFSDYSDRMPSEEELRLSYYGLPEPVGVEWGRKTPVYVWLLVAAGVLGLLALGLRWLAHRRRTTG